MAYSFNIGQFAPSGEGFAGWAGLHQALAQISQQRHARQQQEQALAAQAQQNELARQAQFERDRIAEENARAEEARKNAREAQQVSAQAVQAAMQAVSNGQPEIARAIMAGAAPFGAQSRWVGRETPAIPAQAPQLREPMTPAQQPAVQPQQAMSLQLREPMAPVPGTAGALTDLIAREQGRLSLGDQGRQIGWTGRELRPALDRLKPVALPPNVREYLIGGKLVGSQDLDIDEARRVARAQALAAPGALSHNPLAKSAAERAQGAAAEGARVGPTDEAVGAALGTRKDELGLIGRQAALDARQPPREDRGPATDDRLLFNTLERDHLRDPVPAAMALNNLRATLTTFRKLPADKRAGMGRALANAMARASGEVGVMTQQDVAPFMGAEHAGYAGAVQQWVDSKVEGELPEILAERIEATAEAMLSASTRLLEASKARTEAAVADYDWRTEYWRNTAIKRVQQVYDKVLKPENTRAAQRARGRTPQEQTDQIVQESQRTVREGFASPQERTQQIVDDSKRTVEEGLGFDPRNPLEGL